jgi:FkbM family methyltransferase
VLATAFYCALLYGYWRNIASATDSSSALPRVFSSGSVSQPLLPAVMRVVFYGSSTAPLMSGVSVLRSVGNKFYQHAFPIYRPLYSAYKAYADRAERQLLRQVLFPGAVAVDAGANIGIYSRFLARCVGEAGAVHSFEPAPENFKRLLAATRRCRNVHVLQAAVGERGGHSELYLSRTLNVDHRTYPSNEAARRVVRIEMVALDDYFKPGQRVDLVKMDIQGYELHALRGAGRVLTDNPNAKLLLELWPYGLKQAGAKWVQLVDALRRKNMTVSEVTTHGLVPLRFDSISETADCYVNLFASRRS